MRNSIAVLAFVFAAIALVARGAPTESATPTKKAQSAEVQALVGRWVRTDYPYTIEINTLNEDGTMEAAYFNPKPIFVGRAEYAGSVAGPVATVELRDINYPGSTYTLTWDRTRDVLVGTYFQAVEGETFEVMFVRPP